LPALASSPQGLFSTPPNRSSMSVRQLLGFRGWHDRDENTSGRGRRALALGFACLAWLGVASAQDLEPRRWTHLPVGTNVVGVSGVHTQGLVGLDPLLELVDGTVDVNTVVTSYTRSFDLLGKTGRVDVILPYQQARYDGLLSGSPANVRLAGLADPWVRLSVGVAGAPALKGKEFQDYYAAHSVNTVAGVALGVMLPLGEYMEDKLLNLGSNRFAFRPQVGVLHTRGPWSFELTSSVFLFTDNDDFFGGRTREQDPLFAVQGHVIHSFPNRMWLSLSGGTDWGGESTVDGVPKGDDRADLLSAVSCGFSMGESQGLKLAWVRSATREDVGSDTDSLLLSWSVRF